MLYEFLRIFTAMILQPIRFFRTAFGISRLIQRTQIRRLHDQAGVTGFNKKKFGKKWDRAELSGKFSEIKVKVKIRCDGASRTGTFINAKLKGNPQRLELKNGLFNYFIFKSYNEINYPRFSTGHEGFDTTFLVRFADKKTAQTLTESKDLLDEITRFYRRWVLFTHSFSIENTGERTKLKIRFTYGYHFNPYIRPEVLREVVKGIVRICSLWNDAFG